MSTSKRIFRKIQELNKCRDDLRYLVNRNPRNLERLRIAYKTDGYHLEKPGRNYWHKLELVASNKYITAKLNHFKNGTVIESSTSEWAIKKNLFKGNDTSAYINLARIFAARCMEAGLTEMRCDLQPKSEGKTDKFLKTLVDCGIQLQEPERMKPTQPWDAIRPEKPWEIIE
ncbi:39S ribosomal protein L18, mitochondrial [Toxorhynchites rutilus septentrionalis]|uniref:39S ribosomal protein L18, mitochondrial n=1 Tax=Toxorhynchites rutilus septentrionalis TaxID=329112 RepID=UPI00247A9A57|nr:39S ribosomal protein L18, mitochondrial [Toxorhynchites rutilus septentrionalis]